MRILVWISVTLLGSISIVSCGSDSSGDGPGTPASCTDPVSVDCFAREYVKAYCSGISDCCKAESLPLLSGDCENLAGLRLSGLADSVKDGSLGFDANAAKTCLTQAKALGAACGPLVDEKVCATVFKGTASIGEPCSSDFDCLSGTESTARCDPNGVCVRHRAELGDPCLNTCKNEEYCAASDAIAAQCWLEDGLTCDLTTEKCVARSPSGGPCTFDHDCVDGAYCTAGTCGPTEQLGASCFVHNECGPAAYCAVDVCTADKAAGGSCSEEEECSSSVCTNGKCEEVFSYRLGALFFCDWEA